MSKLYYYRILEPKLWKDSLTHAYQKDPKGSPKELGEEALKFYASSGGKLASAKVSHHKGFLHRVADDLVDQYDTTKDDLVETFSSAQNAWNNSPKGGVVQIIEDGGKVIKTVGPQAVKSALALVKLLGTAELVALPEEAAAAEVIAAPLEAAAAVELAAAPEELAVAVILL